MSAGNCVRGLAHRFDPVSGWCDNGCGWREDGQSAYRGPRRPVDPREVPDVTQPRRGAVDR